MKARRAFSVGVWLTFVRGVVTAARPSPPLQSRPAKSRHGAGAPKRRECFQGKGDDHLPSVLKI